MRRKAQILVFFALALFTLALAVLFTGSSEKHVTVRYVGLTNNESGRFAQFDISNAGYSELSVIYWVFERPQHTNMFDFRSYGHESERYVRVLPGKTERLALRDPPTDEHWRVLIAYEVLDTRNSIIGRIHRNLSGKTLERLPVWLQSPTTHASPSDWID